MSRFKVAYLKALFLVLAFALSWLWPSRAHGQVNPADLLAVNELAFSADLIILQANRALPLELRTASASAAIMRPGVGLPGVPAGFSRYGPGVPAQGSWQGFFAELRPATTTALANACRANYWGSAATHDCQPTVSEEDWTIVYTTRRSDLYRVFWWEAQEGGTSARPIVLTAPGRLYDSAKRQAGAAFRQGLFSFQGAHGWPLWVDNQVAEVVVDPPKPDDPGASLRWLLDQLRRLISSCDRGFCPGVESSGRLEMKLEP